MPSFKVLVPRVPLGATRVFKETLRWAWKDGHGVMGCSIHEGMVHLWKLHTFKDAPCPLGVGRLLNDIQKHQHVNVSVTQRATSSYRCNKEYRILEEATQFGFLQPTHYLHDSAVAVLIQCIDNATMRFEFSTGLLFPESVSTREKTFCLAWTRFLETQAVGLRVTFCGHIFLETQAVLTLKRLQAKAWNNSTKISCSNANWGTSGCSSAQFGHKCAWCSAQCQCLPKFSCAQARHVSTPAPNPTLSTASGSKTQHRNEMGWCHKTCKGSTSLSRKHGTSQVPHTSNCSLSKAPTHRHLFYSS